MSFENVAEFKRLGIIVTKSYHSLQNILSSCLLIKTVKIKICKAKLQFYLLFCMGVKSGL